MKISEYVDISYSQVYYVQVKDHKLTLNPLAICPRILNRRIEWRDTSRGTMFAMDEIVKLLIDGKEFTGKLEDLPDSSKIPKTIEIITNDGLDITLTLLTLEIYNQEVKDYVYGSPSFKSDEEVRNYYLNTSF